MRRTSLLAVARLALVWFVLTLGAAVVTPALGGSSVQLLCTGSGFKLIDEGTGGNAASHDLQCPACFGGAPAPVLQNLSVPALSDTAQTGSVVVDYPPTVRHEFPPPSRAPPVA